MCKNIALSSNLLDAYLNLGFTQILQYMYSFKLHQKLKMKSQRKESLVFEEWQNLWGYFLLKISNSRILAAQNGPVFREADFQLTKLSLWYLTSLLCLSYGMDQNWNSNVKILWEQSVSVRCIKLKFYNPILDVI